MVSSDARRLVIRALPVPLLLGVLAHGPGALVTAAFKLLDRVVARLPTESRTINLTLTGWRAASVV